MELFLNYERLARIDEDDYDRVIAHRWFVHFTRPGRTGLVYARGVVGGRRVYLHRFIMHCPAGLQVNHINRDTLDCRKENLEIVTMEENLLARVFARGRTREELEA